MSKVHIVMRVGPEWGEVVKVFANKDKADAFAGQKNDKVPNNKTDILERMSHYEVVSKNVED